MDISGISVYLLIQFCCVNVIYGYIIGCKPVISYKCEELLLLAHHHWKVQFAAVFAPVFSAFVLFWLCRHAIRFTILLSTNSIWDFQTELLDKSHVETCFPLTFQRRTRCFKRVSCQGQIDRCAQSLGLKHDVNLGHGSCGLDGKRLACSESLYEGRHIWTHTGSPDFDSIPDVLWNTRDMSMNRAGFAISA